MQLSLCQVCVRTLRLVEELFDRTRFQIRVTHLAVKMKGNTPPSLLWILKCTNIIWSSIFLTFWHFLVRCGTFLLHTKDHTGHKRFNIRRDRTNKMKEGLAEAGRTILLQPLLILIGAKDGSAQRLDHPSTTPK